MEVALRPYQADAIARARQAYAAGKRRILIQAETGAGKTEMAVAMTLSALQKASRTMFVASGRRLVGQAAERFWKYDIECGVLMAGEDFTPSPVQVASKDTLVSWIKRGKFDVNEPDVVFVDEAHEAMTTGWLSLLKRWPNAAIFGLTATPARADGRGLGDYFEEMICTVPPSVLIAEKWLVPCRVFAPFRPDLKGVKLTAGDYNKKQLAAKMNQPTLVGNVITHWQDHGGNRPTLAFAVNVKHSMALCEEFNGAGIPAKHMDADTEDDDRKQIYSELESGAINVICSVGVNTRGVDLPFASCLVIVRPTKSFVLFRQMLGRGKRPFLGKGDCIVLDHSGCVYRHGMPDNDIEWSLDVSEKVQDRMSKPDKQPALPINCPKCHCLFTKSAVCPECGYVLKKQPAGVQVSGGRLVELDAYSQNREGEDAARIWHHCLAVAANKGRSASFAAHMFNRKLGKMPWKVHGLPNLPEHWQWKRPVSELFPGYCRGKPKANLYEDPESIFA